ncbi:MAG: BamA/TamA family outer membrane protein [Prevotella sp.]|nr:BamA/TamA family outer membrane protein [Prevotella sp.]
MRRNNLLILLLAALLASCSMTKNIPEDDQLFRGLTKIAYEDEHPNAYIDHLATTKEEVEAALATVPNGAYFGSSYYAKPFSFRLWVYNKYSTKDSKFAKWMTKTFGKAPILMSQVNPNLRAAVAKSVLRNNGYFRGEVTYAKVPLKNPKKSKISYTVKLDSLFTYDSVAYVNFPPDIKQLIDSTLDESVVRRDEPFDVATLDGERTRISTLLRNNGYYFYNPSYASYLADTFAIIDKAQLRFQLANELPSEALRKWYVGNIEVLFRKSMRTPPTDTVHRRHLTIYYSGKKPPVRPRVVLKNLKLRPRQLFSYDKYLESVNNINSTGMFSNVDLQFTPRQDKDTLDLRLNCTFDKPYNFYIETNFTGSTIGRYGPEVKLGFTKHNAFRGGEELDINLHGSYEWANHGGSRMSNYQYGSDISIEFPRIIAPFYNSDRIRRNKNGRPKRRNYTFTPTTIAKISADVVQRPTYYKMNIVSGEWTYRWQSSAQSTHQLSPFTLKYQHMGSWTEKFDSIRAQNVYLFASMSDQFTLKMRYTYTYKSPAAFHHPIRWETTVEEAGNLLSLYDRIGGHAFTERNKKLFNTPYSQFIRLETDLTKTWNLNANTNLLAHFNGGLIYSYGNSIDTPFSEVFYAGGANSIRAFNVRGIGPGSFGDYFDDQMSYLMRNGDIKLIGNLEYRTRLFGDLHGAVFLDAGNVWTFDPKVGNAGSEEANDMVNTLYQGTALRLSSLFDQIALGTGFGLRYDLGFLVIRVDWGVALHFPYDTGKSGYFNINRFKDAHTLHFAVGYPF